MWIKLITKVTDVGIKTSGKVLKSDMSSPLNQDTISVIVNIAKEILF